VTIKIHPSFESLAIIDALGLKESLMDIHHDISFRFIMEDDSFPLLPKFAFTLVWARGWGYG
jgi:hypothetical protein